MVMKALVLFSLTQCLTAVFLGYQGEVEWLGGRRGGLGKGCEGGGYLPKGTVKACETAVQKEMTALCFASGGLNPKIIGDKDHYNEDAWKAFPKGGITKFNFCKQLTTMDCMYCPAVGYWPEAEQSMMIACNEAKAHDALLEHCVYSGVLLNQDAVLYRPPGQGVQMYKTYMLGKDWKAKLMSGKLDDLRDLMQGRFGAADFQAIQEGAEKFGTVFDSCPADVEAQQFAFELDEARTIFCRDECSVNGFQAKCAAIGQGGLVQGLPCDVLCKPPTMQGIADKARNQCVPKKKGCDNPKDPFTSKTEREAVRKKVKTMAEARKAMKEKEQMKEENIKENMKKTMEENIAILENERNKRKARARSLGRRLLRWLRGRARLAQ